MEPQVLGRMPRAGLLLLLPLLLCFGPETAGSINRAALQKIVDHVDKYLRLGELQYAFVVSLPRELCDDPSKQFNNMLEEKLPNKTLDAMKQALRKNGGLYNPKNGNIIAARPRYKKTHSEHSEWLLLHGDKNSRNSQNLATYLPKRQLKEMRATIRPFDGLYSGNIVAARPLNVRGKYMEHSEWRLLSGPNSLVAQLKARTCKLNCCLILFTLNSPCTKVCLAQKGPFNIMQMTSNAFSDIAKDYKAFVFQRIFRNDTQSVVTRKELLEAWHRLHNVPLLRCENSVCNDCAGNDTATHPNPCLAGKRYK
ncbi:uncharacterized protein LOC120394320 [Mauremys reevesii]|uniref:uncharacterized protein LOC120394320 n=1 Tax=Mauremys reevesii TaxID=260615 RepID=UPI00193FD35A|nr:uncharacterized protein LOC120394320 [Mauremys reevesii]